MPTVCPRGASCVAFVALFTACGSSSTSTPTPAASSYSIQAPAVTVAAGQERYVCYTLTLDKDLAVDRFDYPVQDYVHHLFLSRTIVPEQDGQAECDVVFKTTWEPLFIGGKGSTSLQYPPGDANVLPKGSQLVLQLHVVNPSATAQTVKVDLTLRNSTATNPVPVGIYAFGTTALSLPPLTTSSVTNECTPDQDVSTFAILAHMHELGSAMTLETADATGKYTRVYQRNPYDFNNQTIDQAPLVISKGTKTRVTCTYNNTTNATVTFGESSYNEMCYLVMYVPGHTGTTGCVGAPPSDAGSADSGGSNGDGGACAPTANALGIGGPCTAGGGQCASGLSCSADQQSSASGAGFCLKIGCSATSDCGANATCCTPSQGGGAINVCLPTGCVPSDCAIK
jgi:hypothetical protein